MRTLICTLALVVVLASAAQAGEPVAQTFNAPVERVWTVTVVRLSLAAFT